MYTGREVWSPLEAVPCRAEPSRATKKKKGSAKIPSQEKKKARETGVVPELGFGRRSARATTHPQEGSLLGRELLQRVHCQLRRHRLIPLLYSKQTLVCDACEI